MAERKKWYFLIYDVLKQYAPWHSLFGAPDFPKYQLFNPDSTFGSSVKVEKEYNSNGHLSKVTGTNSSQATASIEFYGQTSPSKKGFVVCKAGTTTELTITEWYQSEKVYIDFEYPSDSTKDIQIRVNKVSGKDFEYYAEIDINSKTLTGSLEIAVETVPQIVLDLNSELTSMASTAKVKAFEDKMIENIVVDPWGFGSYPRALFSLLTALSGLGTVLADTTGPQDSVLVYCANMIAVALSDAGDY